jgi:hypothetical protein
MLWRAGCERKIDRKKEKAQERGRGEEGGNVKL